MVTIFFLWCKKIRQRWNEIRGIFEEMFRYLCNERSKQKYVSQNFKSFLLSLIVLMLRALKMSGTKTLIDKIRGSMIGAVVGDCLGSPVECKFWEGIEPAIVLRNFIEFREEACKLKPRRIRYTDDTAMVRFNQPNA